MNYRYILETEHNPQDSLAACLNTHRHHTRLISVLRPAGTRESAFVHAISAAGVAHSVTRSCSMGQLSSCGCESHKNRRRGQDFRWAGCSENVRYGIAFSKKFVDARERLKGKSLRTALVNLHNNHAGRLV